MFGKDYSEVDAAIAIEHMVLAATALGIGSCWVGWFSEGKVKKLLKVPTNARVVALLPLGYPQLPYPKDFRMRPGSIGMANLAATSRRPINNLISFEHWEF